MCEKELSSKDFLLAVLYSPGINKKCNEPIMSCAKIMKLIFLFDKEIYKHFFNNIDIKLPKFESYCYGPFSTELFKDLQDFILIRFIESEETYIPISLVEKYETSIESEDEDDYFNNNDVELKYKLSKIGEKYTKERIWDIFTPEQKEIISIFKSKINTISLYSLLEYICKKYPDSFSK